MPKISKTNSNRVSRQAQKSDTKAFIPNNSIVYDTLSPDLQSRSRLSPMYKAVVGTTAQVAQGYATHSVLQTAIDDCTDGDMIILLTSVNESIDVDKALSIEGLGIYTVVTGTFTVSGSFCDISRFRIIGNIVINGNANFLRGWQYHAPVPYDITDNGTANVIDIIQYS